MIHQAINRKFLQSGISTHQKNLTMGVNLIPARDIRLQLNYTIKETEDGAYPDPDDNILFLNFQYSFNVDNLPANKNAN